MIAPSAYPSDYAPGGGDDSAAGGETDGGEFGAGTCATCDSRIRTTVQQGADHCLQCREGSA